jgi:AraC-like DNA-binding protein
MREIVEGLAERHSESAGTPSEQKYDLARINRALQYLEANYDQSRSLNKLADVSSFSTSHFLRTFTRVVGLTPRAYLTQFRIEAAASLLRTGVAIAEVAAAVGFTDQSHLTKRFKSILGVTPGQYTPKSDPSPRRDLRRNLLIRRCVASLGVVLKTTIAVILIMKRRMQAMTRKSAWPLLVCILILSAAVQTAQAKRHSAPQDAVIVEVEKLPLAMQRPGDAIYLHPVDCEFTYLYLEQDGGKKLTILDISQPARIKLKAEVILDSPAVFDFVQRIGTHAVLIRYRDGTGFGILELTKAKAPVLKSIDAVAMETYIVPANIQSNSHSSQYIAADSQDYQIIDKSNSQVLATVKQVHQELNDFASGATYLLGKDGVTVIRNPRAESFVLPCRFYDNFSG